MLVMFIFVNKNRKTIKTKVIIVENTKFILYFYVK